MTASRHLCAGPTRRLAVSILCLCAFAAALGARHLEVPGLYYDEVIQAEPAVRFLTPGSTPLDIPGMQTIRLFGGWFPVMTQAYMGALKSWALIPVFAAFEASKLSLRATTFAWALVGLVFSVLWARQLLGLRGAVLAGALLAVDPSFLFIGRHDWGSFSLALVCRSGGLYFLMAGAARVRAARAGAAWRWCAAGFLLGAALFNKIDAAVVLAAVALAALLAAPGELRRVLGGATRSGLASAGALLGGFALGALPLLASLGRAVSASAALVRGGAMSSSDWREKLETLATTLDGSYFHRLMLTGGSFDDLLAATGAAANAFPALLAASVLTLVALRATDWSEPRERRVHVFLLLATALGALGMFFTPRAVRIHHVLNLYPLPHMLAAAALQALLFGAARDRTRGPAPRRRARNALRAAAALALVGCLASSIRVDAITLREVRSSGGRGRWSDAVERFGARLATEPGTRVVSLDWGPGGPLRFVAPGLPVEEPFWQLWRPGAPPRPWAREGTPRDVYLLPETRLAVFPFGAQFAAAIAGLPPGWIELRRHPDRSGAPAFTSVRIARTHRLVYRDGFEVRPR